MGVETYAAGSAVCARHNELRLFSTALIYDNCVKRSCFRSLMQSDMLPIIGARAIITMVAWCR